MSTYRFERAWHVAAPPARVQEALADLQHYPSWWAQVVAVAKVDDDTARVLCRSVLPYTLDLVLHAVRRDARVLEVRIGGDLSGWSRFILEPAGAGTDLAFAQEVGVAHRGLRVASRVLRPVLRWNHERMMAGCERGLARRLDQDRAAGAGSQTGWGH